MNKVILLGYLVRDPEPKQFQEKNLTISNFSIGVNDMRNYNQSYFFNCVAWNQTAEYVNNNLKKGDFVSIDGRLTSRSYVNQQGAKTYRTEVVVESIKNLGSRRVKSEIDPNEDKVQIDEYLEKKIDVEINDKKIEDSEINDEINNSSIDWDEDLN